MARLPGINFTRSALRALRDPGQRPHLAAWLGSLGRRDPLAKPEPWLPYAVTRHLLAFLPPEARIFEFGSGSSTLFWLARGFSCFSVEHDADWHALVSARLPPAGRTQLVLRRPEPGLPFGGDPADPCAYASADSACHGMNFRAYASAIDVHPDAWFDLVVVDGRSRPSCLRHAIPKLRSGGLLVLDNSDRDYYLTGTRPLLAGFSELTLRGLTPGLVTWSQSTVFTKP